VLEVAAAHLRGHDAGEACGDAGAQCGGVGRSEEMMDYARLKTRHRVEHDACHPNLSLRVHRALSWLDRAGECGGRRRLTECQAVCANEVGRGFVVGDVHGMFDRVEAALTKIHFDRDRDRLFCVGDVIDRGPQSPEVVPLLEQPFVYAVCGHHEDELLQMHAGSAEPNSETWLAGAE
jgi:hypothetical protein